VSWEIIAKKKASPHEKVVLAENYGESGGGSNELKSTAL